ncbi:MAG: DUF1460 domain-containing protein [Alphaproteobacteria bacterium]|nr:DUF1460 domain-containing protein [Alphaproteobacteria bacterium]
MIKNRFLFLIFNFCFFVACSRTDSQYIGEQYLGATYLNNPLGEEVFPDKDPLIRFDAFDCTTFVETVLANGDKDLLTKIRYKNGKVDFLMRNHFIESDWIENNSDFVKNVSNKYSKKTKVRTVVINKQRWFKRVYDIETQIPPKMVKLEYIPYSVIKKIKPKEPLIVLFVIDNPKFIDKIGSDLAVIHMGFLLPNGMLRHASRQYGRVMDTDFKEYIHERAKVKTNIGISLLEIK